MLRLLTIALLLLPSFGYAAGPDALPPEELLSRAKETRREAEAALAEARKNHLKERKALAAELQRHYAELAEARAESEAAAKALEQAEEDAKGAEQRRARAEYRERTLLEQAGGNTEEGIWKNLQERLDDLAGDCRIRNATETVLGRDGTEHSVSVLRLGSFAAYACGADRVTCGLLDATGEGPPRVKGPYIPERQAEALREASSGKIARVPVDVSGTLREREPSEPRTFRTWLAAGGMFVWPILVVAGLGLLLILERVAYLTFTNTPPSLVNDVLSCAEQHDTSAALDKLGRCRTPAARVLAAGVEAREKPEGSREAVMESALLAEAPRLERSLSLLGALAGVAPLLGLLGTVSGMIATFDTISSVGTGNPRLLSGGISEALITTQLGLVVAIPLLLAHAWLRRWAERREAMLEYNAALIFGLDSPEGGPGDE